MNYPHSGIWVRFIYGGIVVDLGKELLKTIQIMINRTLKNYKVDRTYRTIIKRITSKGYVILDETGQERTVPCCIPNIELRPMQSVYVKEPLGRINELHICGIAESTSNSARRNRGR